MTEPPSPPPRTKAWRPATADVVLGVVAILVVATVAVILANHMAARPRRLLAVTGPPPVGDVDVATAARLRGIAVFVDARPTFDYIGGHIDGALSLPADRFDARVAEAHTILTANRDVVVYADVSSADSAPVLAARLRKAGLREVRVLQPGFTEWEKAGLPTRAGRAP